MAKQASTNGGSTTTVTALMPLAAPLNGALMAAFAHSGEVFAQACAQWQSEVAAFVAARLKADQELQASLTDCDSPTTLAAVQRDWAKAAAEAYLEESTKLMDIGMAAARDGMASWLDAARQSAPAAATTTQT